MEQPPDGKKDQDQLLEPHYSGDSPGLNFSSFLHFFNSPRKELRRTNYPFSDS